MEREIAALKDHYIICGAGRVGSSVAWEDGEILFNPHAGDAIQAGDYLIAMGEPAQLAKLEAMAQSGASIS
jgi:Trk K+ transport system NAD-binding subunit